VSERLGGTPLHLTLVATAAFYAYAWWRRVPRAESGFAAVLAALVLVAPTTRDLSGIMAPRPAPLVALALLQIGLGVRRRDSWRCLTGAACAIGAIVVLLGEDPHRGAIAFHLAILTALVLGAAFEDELGQVLRLTVVALLLAACVKMDSELFADGGAEPRWLQTLYPPAAALLLVGYARLLGYRFAALGAGLAVLGWLAALVWHGYESLRRLIAGLDLIAGGLVLLALAEVISLAKAGLLARWVFHKEQKVSSRLD
jgi:hypothetical protein